MLGARLRAHLGERALQAGRQEVEAFVAGLAAMSERDVGALVAVATVIRVNLETHGVVPEGLFATADLPPPADLGRYQMDLNRLARQFARRRQAEDAAAALVWSYSLRCLNVSGLRETGRRMWAELARGFPHVERALDEGERRRRAPLPARVRAEWRLVPVGLEPR